MASGRDWRNSRFAVCDAPDTPEAYVFGDGVFRSKPVTVDEGKRRRSGDDMERARFWFVFCP